MEYNPLISVIVPIYNTAKHLVRCIESILAQNYPYFELILINDGSTDKSGDICDSYSSKDTRIKVIHKTNGGAASARNLGLNVALGEFIIFIDSDDYISNHMLHDYINRDVRDIKICGIYMKWHNWQNNIGGASLISDNHKDCLLLLSQLDILTIGSPCNKLYRKSIIEQNNICFPTETGDSGEDFIFNIRYLKHCNSFECMPQINYFYEYNPESLTCKKHTDLESNISDIKNTLSFMNLFYQELFAFPDDLKSRILSKHHSFFSDKIVRFTYLSSAKRQIRIDLLNQYKTINEFISYPRFKASKGLFNKLITLSCYLPTYFADISLKLIFTAKRLIIRQ